MRVANGDHAGASGIVLAWPSFGAGDKKGLVCTLCGLAWGGLRRTGLPSPGVLSADNPLSTPSGGMSRVTGSSRPPLPRTQIRGGGRRPLPRT